MSNLEITEFHEWGLVVLCTLRSLSLYNQKKVWMATKFPAINCRQIYHFLASQAFFWFDNCFCATLMFVGTLQFPYMKGINCSETGSTCTVLDPTGVPVTGGPPTWLTLLSAGIRID